MQVLSDFQYRVFHNEETSKLQYAPVGRMVPKFFQSTLQM